MSLAPTMLRPAPRCLFRQAARPLRRHPQVRRLGSAPPHLRPRSWRSSLVRWGVAVGGIYWYNTSPLFAAEPTADDIDPSAQADDATLPTLASLAPSSRFRPPTPADPPTISPAPTSASPPSLDPKAPPPQPSANTADAEDEAAGPDASAPSPQGLEDEAAQQGAFNEETGEINWDCPCLGGMAHGPCGEEFKTAFSCFVFSKEEPKGMDCIENFKGMQDCFRRYPEIYSEELRDDDEEEGEGEKAGTEGAEAGPQDGATVAAREEAREGKRADTQPASTEVAAAAASSAEKKPETLAAKAEPVAQSRS